MPGPNVNVNHSNAIPVPGDKFFKPSHGLPPNCECQCKACPSGDVFKPGHGTPPYCECEEAPPPPETPSPPSSSSQCSGRTCNSATTLDPNTCECVGKCGCLQGHTDFTGCDMTCIEESCDRVHQNRCAPKGYPYTYSDNSNHGLPLWGCSRWVPSSYTVLCSSD